LKGNIAGQPFEREIAITLPSNNEENKVLSSLWARTKVEELTAKSWDAESEQADPKPMIRNQIIKLGTDFGIMTQFTSFVAVEERIVTRILNGKRVRIPVYAPAGTAFEEEGSGGGGGGSRGYVANIPAGVTALTLSSNRSSGAGSGGGMGSGSGRGMGSSSAAPPPPPAKAHPTPAPAADTNASVARLNQLTYMSPQALAVSTRTVSGGVLNGKATSLPKPAYPAAARHVRATGAVSVQITIDETGNVIAAKAVSGHPLLRTAAEQAARAAKFVPTLISGQRVKTTGVVTYNFTRANRPATVSRSVGNLRAIPNDDPVPPAPLSRQQKLKEKLHSWIYSLIERREKGEAKAGVNEETFVNEGKASVRIVLTGKSPQAIEKLKSLGFEVESVKGGVNVFGRIAVEKLAELVEMDSVKYILPQ
jgi:TonB family protein